MYRTLLPQTEISIEKKSYTCMCMPGGGGGGGGGRVSSPLLDRTLAGA